MKKYIIIVAGGKGSRMHSEIPKQFMMLGDKPVLIHSLEIFANTCPGSDISIVLPGDEVIRWHQLLREFGCTIHHAVIHGGETRFHSVQNALATLEGEGLVAIHDGARPLVSESLIRRAFVAAENLGNAVPAIPLNESVRMVEEDSNITADRSVFRIIQTPQVFRLSQVKKAYEQRYRKAFTDDATVLEATGENINLIEGDPANIKVTRLEDLVIAQALITRPFQR